MLIFSEVIFKNFDLCKEHVEFVYINENKGTETN